jgi:hypothetical protein
MKAAAKLCPRWASCSVNNCPLDPHQRNPLDAQQRCPMEKRVRLRIAAQFPGMIQRDGLSRQEWAAREFYSKLPSSTKLAGLERLKIARSAKDREIDSKSTGLKIT